MSCRTPNSILPITALLVLPVLHGQFQVDTQNTAKSLLNLCEAREVNKPTNEQINEGNMCVAYIAGFAEAKGPLYHFFVLWAFLRK